MSSSPHGTIGGWSHHHLLGLQGLDAASIRAVLAHASRIPACGPSGASEAPRRDDLRGRTVATLFFEDSTRTRTSFTLAAQRLGAETVDLSGGVTSVNKGETIVDTALTVEAMGVDAMVIRARQSGAAAMAARRVSCPVINAGDGCHEHPTQGLLDILTIAEAHGRAETFDLSGLTIVVVGDVTSSRVARSGIAGLTALGASVVAVGPPGMVVPAHTHLAAPGGPGQVSVRHDLDPVLAQADAVMMLRIQFERHGDAPSAAGARRGAVIPSIREYRHGYAMTAQRADTLRPGAVVLHPGPMNRGLEIDGEVADGSRSVVLRQVSNGVRVRMAVLAMCHAAARSSRPFA
ncbi:MAG: aspartate carbamoyltransferase catalytic subunit [Phycisphaeraceae bacterium]|nr:aspartate carbamoyltransferase catalytic subunit [Phycisphaeraceae bacterium]